MTRILVTGSTGALGRLVVSPRALVGAAAAPAMSPARRASAPESPTLKQTLDY